MKNIQNLISYKKGYIDFSRQTSLSTQNSHVFPEMIFHNFFWKCCLFQKNLLAESKFYYRETGNFPYGFFWKFRTY